MVHIPNLFRSDDAKLWRIEFLVILIAFFMLINFILDGHRYRTSRSSIRMILGILEVVNYPLLYYLYGLIQNTDFTNELFAIWSVLLFNFSSESDYVTAYGLQGDGQFLRRRKELKELALTFVTGGITATISTNFRILLWVLWSVRPAVVLYRLYSYDVALNSYSDGKNSKLLPEYIKDECICSPADEADPINMRGYKYLVRGESAQTIEATPDCKINLKITNGSKFITLEKVWSYGGRMLRSNRIKDVCIAYSLCKMLRCYIEDQEITQDSYYKTQRLIFEGILHKGEDDERVFRIAEMEIAFFNDYCNTRYPLIILYELLIINLISFVVTTLISYLLISGLHKVDFDMDDNMHIIGGHNFDRGITYVLLVFLVLKELWEIILYTFSDWTKLVIICRYLGDHSLWRCRIMEHIGQFICTRTVIKRWDNRMSQCNFLETFNYRPWGKRLLHSLTLHLIPEPVEGCKVVSKIKIYKEVKTSIVEALRAMNIGSGNLKIHMPPVYKNRITNKYTWTDTNVALSELILVWHIATSMCECHEIYGEGQPRAQHSRLLSPFFWIKDHSWWSQPFPINLKNLQGDLRADYISANSLSRYCAYLLNFAPQLLPDNTIIPELVFQKTISDARNLLHGCDSLESVYQELMKIGGQQGEAHAELAKMAIFSRGVKLGWICIISESREDRWKLLAKFWANLFIYVAPTEMTYEHTALLTEGGEFITLIWTMLAHAGIFDRSAERGGGGGGGAGGGGGGGTHGGEGRRVPASQELQPINDYMKAGMTTPAGMIADMNEDRIYEENETRPLTSWK